MTLAPSAQDRFVILTGPNGSGKTGIVEALSMLAPGRGLRGAAITELPRDDGPGSFAISAALDSAQVTLGTGTSAERPSRREARVNAAAASQQQLAEWLALSWLTPAQDRLFTDPPTVRRRFFDRLTFALDPTHATALRRYERALGERNRLLAEDKAAAVWMDAIEIEMADAAAAIDAARGRLMAGLDALLASDDKAGSSMAHPAAALTEPPREAAEWQALWRQARAIDRLAGRTRAGPHRTDIIVRNRRDQRAASRASTGEQQAMLIAIIVAHARLIAQAGERPLLLLLDDAAAHLDQARRQRLFDRLSRLDAQIWITMADPGSVGRIDAPFSHFQADSNGRFLAV